MVGYYVAPLEIDRKHFLSLYSERRTTLPLVINKVINYGQIESIDSKQLTADLLVKNLAVFDKKLQRRGIESIRVVNETGEVADNMEEDELFSDSEDECYDEDMCDENNGVSLGETVSRNEENDELGDESYVSETEVTGNENLQLLNGLHRRTEKRA